jgi:hypothetical protein
MSRKQLPAVVLLLVVLVYFLNPASSLASSTVFTPDDEEDVPGQGDAGDIVLELPDRHYEYFFPIVIVGQVAVDPSDEICTNYYTIPNDVDIVNGAGNFSHVQGGDCLLIPAGSRGPLAFMHLVGTPKNPIVIINQGGKTTIDANGDDWVALNLYNCEHVRLTGTGDPDTELGLELRGFTNAGLIVWQTSQYIEIDHIEIHAPDPQGPEAAGIRARTRTENAPEGWVQHDLHIHHCYIHDLPREAMYIGNAPWQRGTPLHGLEIHDNLVENIGWDGIQVRNATEGVQVYHNVLKHIGLALGETTQAGAALDIGVLSTGNWHANRIYDAHRGIHLLDAGEVEVYNNLIVNAGHPNQRQGAICWFSAAARVYNNTIVNSYDYGIRASSTVKVGEIWNNIVAGSGGEPIKCPSLQPRNNLVVDTPDAGFLDPQADNFHLQPDSPAVSVATVPYPAEDLDGVARPQEGDPDIGAYECNSNISLTTNWYQREPAHLAAK